MFDPLSLRKAAENRNKQNIELMAKKADLLELCSSCLRIGIIRYSQKTGKYHCTNKKCYREFRLENPDICPD